MSETKSKNAEEEPSPKAEESDVKEADLEKRVSEHPEALLQQEILQRLESLSGAVMSRLALDFTDMNRFLLSTKRLLVTNFFMGIARGVGFLLGATLVGTLAIYFMAKVFDQSMKALKKDVTMDRVISQVAEIRNKFMNALEEEEDQPPFSEGIQKRASSEWIPPVKETPSMSPAVPESTVIPE